MSTQQDICAAGSENRPPMLNKENYVPWSSRLFWYAKSRPRKLIYNSIINGSYVRRMIPEPGDQNRETILLGLPEDIYAAVDSCETAQEIGLRFQQMIKGSDIEIQEKKAKLDKVKSWKLLESYGVHILTLTTTQMILLVEKKYPLTRFTLEQMLNNVRLEVEEESEMSLELLRVVDGVFQPIAPTTAEQRLAKVKSWKLLESCGVYILTLTTTQMILLVEKKYPLKRFTLEQMLNNVMLEVEEESEMSLELLRVVDGVVQPIAHTTFEQRLTKVKSWKLLESCGVHILTLTTTQMILLVEKKYPLTRFTLEQMLNNVRLEVEEESEMSLELLRNKDLFKSEDPQNQNGLIVVLGVANQNSNGNGNYVAARAKGNSIGNNDGSAEVHNYDNCYDNEIFNMFTQEEQYTDLLEPISKPHQVQQNDNNVISKVSSVEQDGGTIYQHPATVKETRVSFESLYNNLTIETKKVNSVNRKVKETNADLTTKLARYKNQEKCLEISQEKYDKLKRCYQKSIYQEQCLNKKINALHLSSDKQITTLNEEISNLNKQLSKEKSTVSSLLEEKKRLKSDFKIRKDELLDKQIQLENKIKELDNIVVKKGQPIQTMYMLSPNPDSFYHTKQKMALGYQNPLYLKQAQQK
nr:hypothetical protein [Tanacetum cinerariifolium]